MSLSFQAFRHRNYRYFFVGGVISNTGTWMQRVAQDWLVLLLATNDGTALGITTGLQFLPMLLLSPVAGAVADRFPRRDLLSVLQLCMMAPSAVLGILAITGQAQTWHVYVLAFFFGLANAFEIPARQAFVGELVEPEDLPNAIGLNSASFNAGRIVGPGIAGLMIAALGSGVEATGLVILFNAVSYLAVLFSLRRIRTKPAAHLADHRGPGAVRRGVKYVWGRPDLLHIFAVMFFMGTFGLNFQLTSALMATEVYGKGAGEFGLLGTTMAVGALTGALLAAGRKAPTRRIFLSAALAFSLAEIVIGLMPTYVAFAALTPLIGFTAMTTMTTANTLVQISVPSRIRGRVMAIYLMILMGGTPLGAPLIGWVGETFGARWTLIGGGAAALVGMAVSTWVYLAVGRRRPFPDPEAEPEEASPSEAAVTAETQSLNSVR